MINNNIEEVYNKSLELSRTHYENFPVVSLFVPKYLRKHVAVVYAFARIADDMADEGDIPAGLRLKNLDRFEDDFNEALKGNFRDPFWQALGYTIKERQLNPVHFTDLLKAFKQDVVKKRYASFPEILDYCAHSANPVGRIILELYGLRDEKMLQYSDDICTGLQLTNFYQDMKTDYERGRIYIPKDEMERFNVSENDFELNENNANFKLLIKYQVDRVRELFVTGRQLLDYLPKLLKLEIKWTVYGGERILYKIEKNDFDVLSKRPKLSRPEYLGLIFKAII